MKEMVRTWKDGRITIVGIEFMVNEDVIVEVIGIPIVGIKFYRDKKISAAVVKEFAKDDKERNELVKTETYYDLGTIKKLHRFVLHAIISYITLDTHYDRVRTHYFVLLIHFWHGNKISIPFYLFSLINHSITRYKGKLFSNPTFHEGLLFLIYKHFKVQTHRRTITQATNTDSIDLHSEGDEEVAHIMQEMGNKKYKEILKMVKDNTNKDSKGLGGRILKCEVISDDEEYSEDDERMETKEENSDKEKNIQVVKIKIPGLRGKGKCTNKRKGILSSDTREGTRNREMSIDWPNTEKQDNQKCNI